MSSLTFRLGTIPVRVHVSFLVISAMLGAGGRVTLVGLVQWVLVVFVGVLLHELGHAFAGRTFGLAPQIDLQGMGGLTSWGGGRRNVGTWRSVVISLAGPLTGIAIGVTALVYARSSQEPLEPRIASLVSDVVWVNLGWGVLNLLPILPLDGGNVLFELAQKVTGGRGERPARFISIGFAVAVGIFALVEHNNFGALMVAYFAFFNYQALQASNARM
jgi:membrane-associated protease RseP (regulator of RpoE activity)